VRGLPEQYVPRPRLVRRLSRTRVAAVRAGGGYGKSVLAAKYAAALDLPAGEALLEPGDDDPARLVARLRAALARVGWSDLTASLDGSAPGDAVDALRREAEPRLLVIDDVHHAASAARLLARLLDGLPAPHRALVLGRRLPRPVEDAVVLGGAVPLDAGELAFTTDEVSALYGAFGVELADHDADALRRGTAGWAAALVLAGPRLARGEDVASEVEALTAQGAVLSHLVRRQLEELGTADRTAAVQAAHLPLLSEPVVDAASDEAGLFERLVRSGLPLSPRRDGWYELPGPVQELISALEPLEPEVARRAARAYADAGETVAAIQVLLAARLDLDTAVLLAELPASRLEQLDYLDLKAAVDALAPEAVDAHPRVLIGLAHSCEGAGQFSVRGEALAAARATLAAGRDPLLAREVEAEIARDLVRDGRPDEADTLAAAVLAEAGARCRPVPAPRRARPRHRRTTGGTGAVPPVSGAQRALYGGAASISLKKTPPIPFRLGTLSGGAAAVSVVAETLYRVFENSLTPGSSPTSETGTSIVIVPFGPVTAVHAPGAVSCVVPGYVRATPPPSGATAFSPTQHWIAPPPTDSA
jgi:ATP/maltotriose-dependent transcriptional regulator MalT